MAFKPTISGDPPIDYDDALGRLARERKIRASLSHHRSSGGVPGRRRTGDFRRTAEVKLGGYRLRGAPFFFGQRALEASATVNNFATRDEKVKITIKGNGTTLNEPRDLVRADKSASASFEGLPEYASYQAEIDVRDALALDNRRFATAPASRNLRILAVTPLPQALTSLRSIPGVSVDVVAPADYPKSERTGYGLKYFISRRPKSCRKIRRSSFCHRKKFLGGLGAPFDNVQISNWRESNMLTRYINFSLFRPTYARPLKPQTTGDIVIESPAGALAFALERKRLSLSRPRFRSIALYLGRENLPMSIFTT